MEEYKRHLKERHIQEMISKHKHTMDYLAKHTGKHIETTSAVYYLYNLLKEEVSKR